MLYDVAEILKNFGESLEICETLDFSSDEKVGAAPVFDKVSLKGSITNIGGVLEAKLVASGTYRVLCSRCTKEISKEFEEAFTEILVSADTAEDDDDEAVVFSGNMVDLAEITRSNILLALPVVYLCREDCKGLCIKCGADLNVEKCSCEDEDIDPRWEALKNFVIQDSE